MSKNWRMDTESSSFDDFQNNYHLLNTFSDVVPINKNGATSDCFKVRIHGKWHFLKRPKKAFSTNPLYIAAFEKEFDLGFTLDHSNIVRYISKGTDKKSIYILTEYIDGFTLNDFIVRNPEFFKNKQNVKKILLQLLYSLEYLHAKQIVHLDIKPENILITTNGNNLKLIDLGLSYSDCYTDITGGTQGFGSPEQFTKPELIDYRSDMYAFGKIVLYLFTGNTTILSVKQLPAIYKKLVRECLIEDVYKRNIKASACIQLINKKNQPLFLLFGLILILTLLGIWIGIMKVSLGPKNPPHNLIQETIQKSKNGTPINESQPKSNVKYSRTFSNDSIKNTIRIIISKRLTPNISALSVTYSDINEFNIDVLRQSFTYWKNQCNEDCKLLYEDYKSQITYDQFKKLYDLELNKINSPIQKRLDEFK